MLHGGVGASTGADPWYTVGIVNTANSSDISPALLHRPPAAGPLYTPPARLLAAVEAANGVRRLLLNICAPAGYGKSSLAAAVCRRSRLPVVWLTLIDAGRDDSDLRLQLRRSAALAGFDIPTGSSLEDRFAELSPLVLAVDNAHLLASSSAALLQRIYDSLASPSLLILCSDETHRFTVSRLRMEGELLELRTDDLAARGEEAAALFERLETPVTREQLSLILRRTGGWWACLRLLSLCWRQAEGDRRDQLLSSLAETDRFISEFIAESIDQNLPAAAHELLRLCSVASHLNNGLAGVLSETHEPELTARIRLLEDRFLLVPAGHGWYRSSPMMRRFYYDALPREERRQLHGIAADWFEAAGMGEQAARHRKRSAAPVPTGPDIPLKRREREILTLVSSGLSNAEIGEKLFISAGTVKWHMNNILQKLGASHRTAAVDTARRLKILA